MLFLRKHFEALKQRLAAEGHELLGPDFNVGDGVLDRFIDVPPYLMEERGLPENQWGKVNQVGHLKIAIDGFACTCFGLIIRKALSG